MVVQMHVFSNTNLVKLVIKKKRASDDKHQQIGPRWPPKNMGLKETHANCLYYSA